MAKSADIDRIFAHIGMPEMKYHEFESGPDADQARASWALLHSATRAPGEVGPEPDVELHAPEQRADAFRERVERVVRHAPGEPAADLPPARGEPPHAPPEGPRAQGRPLQQVFSRLSGRADPPPQSSHERRDPQQATTPLSQVFRRLT